MQWISLWSLPINETLKINIRMYVRFTYSRQMQNTFLSCAFLLVVRCILEVTDRIYLYPWKIIPCECHNTSHYSHIFVLQHLLEFENAAVGYLFCCLHMKKQSQNDMFREQFFLKWI